MKNDLIMDAILQLDEYARTYLENRMREIYPCDESFLNLLKRCKIVYNYTDSAFPKSTDVYFNGVLIMKIPAINPVQAKEHL